MLFTGERYLPEVEGVMAYEHIHRYAFAGDYVAGKTVLDIACGEGYGSNLLAKKAGNVLGVDISEEAVFHAKNKYSHHRNLEFRVGSCTGIPSESCFFDVVISFETIEHISDHTKMLDEIKRVLKPDGILIISSPNKDVFLGASALKNEFHLKELEFTELKDLLNSNFKHVEIMGQRLAFSSYMWPIDINSKKPGFIHYYGDSLNIYSSDSPNFEAYFFIAICSGSDNPCSNVKHTSLYTDEGDLLYRQHNKMADELAETGRQLAEKEIQIQALMGTYSWRITSPLRKILKYLKGI